MPVFCSFYPGDPVKLQAIDTKTVEREALYSFSRAEVFSPEKTGNSALKFCVVSGCHGAESMVHTHPGDEVVMTLCGKTRNFFSKEEVCLQSGEILLVPPGMEHSTRVDSLEDWQGVSFYCDECPFVKQTRMEGNVDSPFKKTLLHPSEKEKKYLKAENILSPIAGQSSYLSLMLLSLKETGIFEGQSLPGETIYYCVDGKFQLKFKDNYVDISAGFAVFVPPNMTHTLISDNSNGFTLLAGSCSFCPLIHNRLTFKEQLCWKKL